MRLENFGRRVKLPLCLFRAEGCESEDHAHFARSPTSAEMSSTLVGEVQGIRPS